MWSRATLDEQRFSQMEKRSRYNGWLLRVMGFHGVTTEQLVAGLWRVLELHPIVFSQYRMVDGVLERRGNSCVRDDVIQVEASANLVQDAAAVAQRLAVEAADLEHGTLFHVVVLRGDDGAHACIVRAHHRVWDAPSFDAFASQVVAACEGWLDATRIASFDDVAAAVRAAHDDGRLERHRAFWRGRLAAAVPAFPGERPPPGADVGKLNVIGAVLSVPKGALSSTSRAALYMSAHFHGLHRATERPRLSSLISRNYRKSIERDRIVVDRDLSMTLGYMSNPLVITADADAGPRVLVPAVRRELGACLAHGTFNVSPLMIDAAEHLYDVTFNMFSRSVASPGQRVQVQTLQPTFFLPMTGNPIRFLCFYAPSETQVTLTACAYEAEIPADAVARYVAGAEAFAREAVAALDDGSLVLP